MTIKAILFDLDDTLMYEHSSEDAAFRAGADLAADKYGLDAADVASKAAETARELWSEVPASGFFISLGAAYFEALWGDFSGDTKEYAETVPLLKDYREQTWIRTLEAFGQSDPDLGVAMWEAYYRERTSRHNMIPGAVDVLKQLRERFRIIMLTNGVPGVQREKINKAGIEGLFDAIVISGEVGIGKPDPRIFERALSLAGASRNEALMVGDSPKRDIQGAVNAGIATVYADYDGHYTLDGITPDYTIHTINELPDVIARAEQSGL